MNSKIKRLLFIPCYNCENQVRRILDNLNPLRDEFSDILIIDNNSIDRTLKNLVQEHKANNFFKIMSHHKNYGLGGSFKSAIDYARKSDCEYLYILHGDDQADIKDLREMLTIQEQQDPDCIFGARFMSESVLINYSKIRILGNLIFNLLFSLIFLRKVYDIGSGLNCYKVSTLPINIELWPTHIAFDVNLLVHYMSGSKNVVWMPIHWNEVDQVSTTKNFNVGIKVLNILMRFVFTRKLTYEKEETRREYKLYE